MKKSEFRELIKEDYLRYDDKPARYVGKFIKFFRKAQCARFRLLRFYFRFRYYFLSRKRGIEVSPKVIIGGGLYLGHPFCITVNDRVVLGKNINFHKGVTIGQENRGKRKGVPTIGNEVWFGVNSTVVGNVTIGNDVLIAPNSFVNFDVPSHSIVVGNPGIIIRKTNATEGYINNKA